MANEFRIEITHERSRVNLGGKRTEKIRILHCWLHTAFMREDIASNETFSVESDGGAPRTGRLVLPKAELDGLVKKDKAHKVRA